MSASQIAPNQIGELIRTAVSRLDRDHHGLPTRLYPFTRHAIDGSPKTVVIDPDVSFGRPVIAGTGLATQFIAERFKSGESISELADDYGCTDAEIEEAIRWEVSIVSDS